jgi:hypothetical protein
MTFANLKQFGSFATAASDQKLAYLQNGYNGKKILSDIFSKGEFFLQH